MRLRTGSSGFSYDEWRGTFYPADLKNTGMLRYYAERLATVELNDTFHRMPSADVVASWAEQVPPQFRFAFQASRRITHQQRLKDSLDSVTSLFKMVAILGDKLGPILFQLPPQLRRDTGRLRDFLAVLPDECHAAFEFRDDSWFVDEVFTLLADHQAALCSGDVDEDGNSPPFVATSSWGYLRLGKTSYADGELAGWAERIANQPWQDAYVIFKHEADAPARAAELVRLAASQLGSRPLASPAGRATCRATVGPGVSAARSDALETKRRSAG